MWNCHSWPLDANYYGDRSATATWSANMSSNSSNVKLPFLTTRCQYQWVDVDLPLDLPIWALTVEMWNFHSEPLDATTREVDLPVDLPIWALTVEMWNCHSWPLDASYWGSRSATVDLPIMSSNIRNVKLPFLTTRCHHWRVDLPVDLPPWSANEL